MNTSRLDLNLLRVFAAIYENRTLTLAASQIGLSQPALSHALKRLRDTFEDELFVREGGVYIPTKKSEALAIPILRALEDISVTLEKSYHFEPQKSTSTFRLAISDFGSHTVLPPLSWRLNAQAPNVQCVVSQLSADRYVRAMQSGDLDLAVMSQPAKHADIISESIVDETVVYIAREDHPDLKALSSLKGFAAVGHLLVNLISEPRSGVDKMLEDRGLTRRVKLVVPYFGAVPDIVAKTDLIGGLPRRLAEKAERDYPVKIFPAPFEIPPIQFHMHWHKRKQRDTELRWFRSVVKDVCESL